MENKRFTKNDSGFICLNCQKKVDALGYSSRDHCSFCLCSLHVDNMPGDRLNPCSGLLEPVSAEISAKKGFVINYICAKCGEKRKNMAARDDDSEKLIKLTVPE